MIATSFSAWFARAKKLPRRVARLLLRWVMPHIIMRQLRQQLRRTSRRDQERYWRHSALNTARLSQSNRQAILTMQCHCIEKGLALKEPRPGFGQPLVESLISNLKAYIQDFGTCALTEAAVCTLLEYRGFLAAHGLSNLALDQNLEDIAQRHGKSLDGFCAYATAVVSKTEIHSAAAIEIEKFLRARHSVRQFAPVPVEIRLVERAVELAITAPSVCNRQPWRVHCYRTPSTIGPILRYQNGNRGFSEQIAVLLIVTCDLGCFVSVAERNEAWIDGGMFSMLLLLALHSMGLGTCCLNACMEDDEEILLRQTARIPDNEVIIMMIAVGHLPERFRVTRSQRKQLQEVMVIHGDQ